MQVKIGDLTIDNAQLFVGRVAVNAEPLTLKMQEIETHSGVNIAGKENLMPYPSVTGLCIACENRLSSATEYFNYLARQNLQHLHEQANSVDDAADAEAKLVFYHQIIASIPQFVRHDHDLGPSKLVCDDFRYGNMLVDNLESLNIVGVVDWE